MALVPTLGSTHIPGFVWNADKDSYQCDRAALFFDGRAYGDVGPGMKGEHSHLLASEPMGEKLLTITDDATLLRKVQPDDFGFHGEEDLCVLLVSTGSEWGTAYAANSQQAWLEGFFKGLGLKVIASAKSAWIAQGRHKDYRFNVDANLEIRT